MSAATLERLTARGVRAAAQDAAAEPEGRAGRARGAWRGSGSTASGGRRLCGRGFVALARELGRTPHSPLSCRSAASLLRESECGLRQARPDVGRRSIGCAGSPSAASACGGHSPSRAAGRRSPRRAASPARTCCCRTASASSSSCARAFDGAALHHRLALPLQRGEVVGLERQRLAVEADRLAGQALRLDNARQRRYRPGGCAGSTASAVSNRSVAPASLPGGQRRLALRARAPASAGRSGRPAAGPEPALAMVPAATASARPTGSKRMNNSIGHETVYLAWADPAARRKSRRCRRAPG